MWQRFSIQKRADVRGVVPILEKFTIFAPTNVEKPTTMKNNLNVMGNRNSLFDEFLAEIRSADVQTDSMRFRRNLERIGEIFAYEISKTLKYKTSGASSWSDGGTTDAIITVLTAYGTDKLLVGTQSGFEVSAVGSDGKPADGEAPSDNAESAFGTRFVSGIWHYGAEGTLYAAVIGVEHSQYNKLWGFYTSRNKWNYE